MIGHSNGKNLRRLVDFPYMGRCREKGLLIFFGGRIKIVGWGFAFKICLKLFLLCAPISLKILVITLR